MDNFEKFDTLLYGDTDLERTENLNYPFRFDHTKKIQISLEYRSPIGIARSIRTEYFNFSLFSRGTSITFYLDFFKDIQYSFQVDLGATGHKDITLTIKYKGRYLYFFIYPKLIYVTDYTFSKPVSLYNMNFRESVSIYIKERIFDANLSIQYPTYQLKKEPITFSS